MTNHWLLVGSDILSVVKWVMPFIGAPMILAAFNYKNDADIWASLFLFGAIIYILGVCLLAGVL